MKPADVQPEMFIEYCVESNDKDPSLNIIDKDSTM